MTCFSTLQLSEALLKTVRAQGYEQATPIQLKAIPEILKGRDILGIAQTGTGKTAAFALPILNRLGAVQRARPRHSTFVLVLAPTRELASQIAEAFTVYGDHIRPHVVTIFGGASINRQAQEMQRGADIVVATPGRLIDLLQQGAINLKAVETLVLDEADQMLDLGFIHALKRIVQFLPKMRQTLFFSATMPKAIADLAAQFLTNPVEVAVAPAATTAERVEQCAIFIRQPEKSGLLIHLLRSGDVKRALVFTRTKHGANKVATQLQAAGIGADAIHGNKSQPQREKTLSGFRAGYIRILVATDIAARGIDVDGVTHVFNYDVPNVPEQYVHRIGRTARAGAAGRAIAFVSDEEKPFLRDIERVARIKVPVEPLPQDYKPAARPQAPMHASAPAHPHPAQRQDEPRRDHRGKPAHGPAQAAKPPHAKPHQGKPHHGKPRQDARASGQAASGRPEHGKPAARRFGAGKPGAGKHHAHKHRARVA